jgi:hypothetical protein
MTESDRITVAVPPVRCRLWALDSDTGYKGDRADQPDLGVPAKWPSTRGRATHPEVIWP